MMTKTILFVKKNWFGGAIGFILNILLFYYVVNYATVGFLHEVIITPGNMILNSLEALHLIKVDSLIMPAFFVFVTNAIILIIIGMFIQDKFFKPVRLDPVMVAMVIVGLIVLVTLSQMQREELMSCDSPEAKTAWEDMGKPTIPDAMCECDSIGGKTCLPIIDKQTGPYCSCFM